MTSIEELNNKLTAVASLFGAYLLEQGYNEPEIRTLLQDKNNELNFEQYFEPNANDPPSGNNPADKEFGDKIYKRIYESGSSEEDWEL